MKKIIAAIVSLLVIAAAVFGIVYLKKSRVMKTPLNRDVVSVTWQEYRGETPVNPVMEISHDAARSPDLYYFGLGHKKVLLKSHIPARDVSLQYVLTLQDGSTFVCYEYSDGEDTYVEIPGMGVYRQLDHWNQFSLKSYYDSIYRTSYLNAEAFSLSENYDGSAKAILIDRSDPTSSFWTQYIPEDSAAAAPQEIRFVFIIAQTGSVYTGYWYNVETGEKVADDYDGYYSLTAVDLLMGEETVLAESLDEFGLMHAKEDYIAPYLMTHNEV